MRDNVHFGDVDAVARVCARDGVALRVRVRDGEPLLLFVRLCDVDGDAADERAIGERLRLELGVAERRGEHHRERLCQRVRDADGAPLGLGERVGGSERVAVGVCNVGQRVAHPLAVGRGDGVGLAVGRGVALSERVGERVG